MRKMIDCREFPSESNCSLFMAGEEEELLRAAEEHAVSVHGHTAGPELREQISAAMKEEAPQHA